MEEPTPLPSPLEKLTTCGRVVFLLTFLAFGAFGLWAALEIVEDLQPGQRFPVFILAIPVLGTALACFFGLARLLEKCGVRIYVRNPREP